jgi:hypothetical protein
VRRSGSGRQAVSRGEDSWRGGPEILAETRAGVAALKSRGSAAVVAVRAVWWLVLDAPSCRRQLRGARVNLALVAPVVWSMVCGSGPLFISARCGW